MALKLTRLSITAMSIFILLLCIVGWAIEKPYPEKTMRTKKTSHEMVQKQVRISAIREVAPRDQRAINKKVDTQKANRAKKKKKQKKVQKAESKTQPAIIKTTGSKYKSKQTIRKRNASEMKPLTFKVNKDIVVTGRKLIDSKDSVPIVMAQYEMIGFENYLNKMVELGGRLFIGDAIKQKILAEVSLSKNDRSYAFSGLDTGNLEHLHRLATFRPREISGEPLVTEIITHAQQFHESADIRCVVLLPINREAAFLGALKQYLSRNGYNISDFDLFLGDYIQDGPQFSLRVSRGRMRESGDMVPFKMLLHM